MNAQHIDLLLADDHLLVAQGVERLLLECFGDVRLVQSGEALVAAVEAAEPDVVISDITMEGISGIDAMRRLRERGHDTPFIFLTMHGSPEMASEAIQAGGSGYVLKHSAGEELVRAVQEVMAGRTYVTPTLAVRTISASAAPHTLTDKQSDILHRVARGLRSKQIAWELGLSVRTVESHKYTIMQVLGVHSTVDLVRKASRMGLIAGFEDEPDA
jgi:DNA-binding NarL/FixJ family response regulator